MVYSYFFKIPEKDYKNPDNVLQLCINENKNIILENHASDAGQYILFETNFDFLLN